MLAKQGWRMIQGNDSLLYKCFKARYFPRSSFLDAKESPGCSFVWRSLMAALPILRSGYCWKVGNGSSISVLGDKWIPNHPTNKVLHPIHELVDEMVVSELINPKLHVWRSDMIMSLFHREDVKAICKIPLSRRAVSDSIIWMYNKNGKFFFKSAYKIARRIQVGYVTSRIRRGGNKVAYVLAQHARNLDDDLYWMEDSPPPALEAFYQGALLL
ncbi:hypothetical protein SO802_002552 [Lithocarpus litseifolius]|uniref:Reverse transcriptase n=1 Tax=Lithocarpus litseifolius TaxID=425828 RepID=A0AAW2DXV8_9ROSI